MTTPFRHLSDTDHQKVVDSRIRVSSEIFTSLIDRCKNLLSDAFPSNSNVIHDGDKTKIINLATIFFDKMVSYEDVVSMAADVTIPDVTDVELPELPAEGVAGGDSEEEVGGF